MLELRDYQKNLLKGLTDAMRQGFKRPCLVAPCGSGKTVLAAWMVQQSKGRILFLVHRKELLDQTIATFEKFNLPMDNVEVASVFKVSRNLDKTKEPLIIVMDEGHHATCKTWTKITDRFPDAYVILLTATPCRMDGKPLGIVSDTLVQGVTARELIEQGYLSEYDYYAPQIALDFSDVTVKYGDYVQSEVEAKMDQPKIYGDVIKHYRQLADGKQAIVYCASLKHSRATVEAFNKEGIKSVHIDGETPKQERTEAIEAFRKGEIRILSNMDLISEGFDVPSCDCCILLRPTRSLSLYIQQSMRCMRPAPGKRAVILDFVGNAYRHGLPDEDREWSLDGSFKCKKTYDEGGELKVRQCPRCYYTHKPAAVCPKCGWVYEKTDREIKEEKEAELRKVEEIERKNKRMEVGMCRSYADLKRLGQERGYKPSWAYVMAKKKGLI